MQLSKELTICGDPHAKQNNLNHIKHLFQLIENIGNDVIWLGDLLDTKELIRGSCLNSYYDYFFQSKLNHVILVGNHDWFNLECKEHSLHSLKSLKNVLIVDKSVIQGEYGFLPYIHDLNQFKRELESLKGIVKTVFIHQGINGFDYGNGYKEDNGVNESIFNGFDHIISGHFHSYQRKGNITYLGTPFTHSFGESTTDKYLGLLNNNQLELILTDFPVHRTIELKASEVIPFDLNNGDYYRIIVNGKYDDVVKSTFQIKQQYPNVKVIQRPDISKEELVVEETDSNVVKFKKWAEEIKKLDSEIVKRGIDILS